MHPTRVAVLFIVALLAPCSAQATAIAPSELSFALPAQVGGNVTIAGGVQLLLEWNHPDPAVPAHFSFQSAAPSTLTNRTQRTGDVTLTDVAEVSDVPAGNPDVQTSAVDAGRMEISLGARGAASLYLEAKSIALEGMGVSAEVVGNAGDGLENLRPYESEYLNLARSHPGPAQTTLRIQEGQGGSFHLRIVGVTLLEWANADVSCDSGTCPRGAGWTKLTAGIPGYDADTVTESFEELVVADGLLDGVFANAFVAVAGPHPDLAVDGWLRLPLASGKTDCSGCVMPENRTLSARGHLGLGQMRQVDRSSMSATLDGNVSSAHFDEQGVILSGAALVATAGASVLAATVLGVVAFKLGVILFTRNLKDPLAHPRRQRIHAYVRDHPGANFREVVRGAECPAGTVRHHLTVLVRAKVLMERPHGSTLRFFENHGKFDATWSNVVLLREPELQALHDWIERHPASAQKDVLNAMEAAHGWSRSTSQHRLARLVEGGIVQLRIQGRLKMYALAPAVRPVGLAAIPVS